jgi:multiple sugar transport system substrate-binding protein
MFKRFLVCLLTLALLLGTVPVAMAEAEQTTIRVAWWGSQARHDLTTAAIEKFMEKNPNIKVEVEFIDWGGYWSKLATQVAGGLVPDVIQMDYAYITQYANNNVLEDLTPYIESGVLNVNNISDAMMASAQVGEGVYAVPCGSTSPILMYRKDVLDQAGLTMPIAPTESEFAEIQKQVYDKTGRTNSSITTWDNGVRTILRCYGLNLYNEEGTGLGFDDPSYIVYLFERYLAEIEYGHALGVGEGTSVSIYDQYISDLWATMHSSNELGAYQNGSNCELEMALLPTMDDATTAHSYGKPTMFWSIPKTSEAKDAAIEFINYWTHDTDCADIMTLDRGIPVSSAIREHLAPSLDAASQKIVAIMDYLALEGNSTPVMKPDISAHGEIQALFTSYFEEVQYGLVDDLAAHAQAFMDEANGIIKDSLATN